MNWLTIIILVAAIVGGFLFGKKQHLNKVAQVMLQTGLPREVVDKTIYLVNNHAKLQREARKATKEAYKALLVKESLEKMKKEV